VRTAARTFLATCAVAALACGPAGTAVATTSPRSIANEPARTILARSLTSARAKQSVHAVEVEHAGGQVLTQSDNSNERSGEQLLNFSSGASVDIRLFPTTLFIKANAKGIVLVYGKRDPKYANTWVAVRSSLGAYRTLATGIAFRSLLAEMPPTGTLTKSGVETVAGHRVVAITGKPNQVAQHVGGSETFDVSVAAPYLPTRVDGRLSGNHRTALLTIRFSDWGRNFSISVPRRPLPITRTDLLR
jgi:hypothetical protein